MRDRPDKADSTIPEAVTHLLLIRHGKASDVDGRCIGRTDVPLSPEGAQAMIDLIAGAGVPSSPGTHANVRVFSSDLSRAADSAHLVATAMHCAVERDARLREMNFGEWDGQSWKEIEETDAQRLGAWMEDWVNVPAPNGEGVDDVARRSSEWLEDVLYPLPRGARTLIVVSHAGWIRATIARLTGVPLSTIFSIPADHARLTALRVTPSHVEVVTSNVERMPAFV